MSFCPACLSEGVAFKQVSTFGGDYSIHKCTQCRLEYVDPMPSEQTLANFYANYHDIRAADAVLALNAQRNIETLSALGLTQQSKLLDYGSGKDKFVQTGSCQWTSYDLYTQNNDPSVLKPHHYEFVTSWGVLEHVVDPMALVIRLKSLLQVNGYLIMTTVDIDGAIPYRFKPPEHVTYWTKTALKSIAERTNMTLVRYDPYVMMQDKQVYMSIILRTLPEHLKTCVHFEQMPAFVEVPTNEVFIVLQNKG